MRGMIDQASLRKDIYKCPIEEAFDIIDEVAQKRLTNLGLKTEWVVAGENREMPRQIALGFFKVSVATSVE